MTSTLSDIKQFIFWYPLRYVLTFLPLKAVYIIGDIGGYINSKISKQMFNYMYDELSLIFNGKYSEKEKNTIIKRTFKLEVKNKLEALLYKKLNKKNIFRMIIITGMEKIEHALTKKKGVILLIAHFGANKLVMPALGYNGYRINQVAGKPTEWIRIMGEDLSSFSKKVFELELKNEQFLPANFIYVFESMKPVYKCLKNNKIVCMAIDGGGGTKKDRVRFLGRVAMISSGPFRIAQRMGATILPAFVVRGQNDTHRLIIKDSLEPTPNLSEAENNFNMLQAFMKILEKYVDQYPCHYTYKLARARMIHQKDFIPLFSDYERKGLA